MSRGETRTSRDGPRGRLLGEGAGELAGARAQSLGHAVILGNLGQDPELRNTSSGKAVASADARSQAKRMHDRLAGVPPTEAVLTAMASDIAAGRPTDAAEESEKTPTAADEKAGDTSGATGAAFEATIEPVIEMGPSRLKIPPPRPPACRRMPTT